MNKLNLDEIALWDWIYKTNGKVKEHWPEKMWETMESLNTKIQGMYSSDIKSTVDLDEEIKKEAAKKNSSKEK